MSTRLACVLLVACGGGASTPVTTPTSGDQTPVAVPVTSRVVAPTSTAMTAPTEGVPPVVVLLDAQGQRRLAAAATWNDIGRALWSAGPKTSGKEASRQTLLEGNILGKAPKQIVDDFYDYRVNSEMPGAGRGSAGDDPPPPETEEESGGTGTAMALEEGRMGRKPGAPVGPFRGRVYDVSRFAAVVGEVSNAKLEHVPALVVADPRTKAAVVVEAVSDLEAMIGVWSANQLRPLRILFHRDRDHEREPAGAWIDVELAASLTIDGKVVELTALKPALDDVKQRRKLANAAVDVLVGPDVEAQRLVDVLAVVDGAGVTSIGLGLVPTEEQRKASLPMVVAAGQPNSVGDLDKALIRRYVKQNIDKIRYCYEKALLAKPTLRGTVQVQFFITGNGTVVTSSGAGVDPDVANCVAKVIKGIEFPKPKGGGGVQVNYPFTFRPEGANPGKP